MARVTYNQIGGGKKKPEEEQQKEGLLAEPAATPQGNGNPPAGNPAGAQGQAAQQAPDYGSLSDHYLKLYADGQFNYDFNDDPKYQMARDAYMRQGQINAKNVAAQAAQLTGGYGNSYGTVAAQQVMNQAANDVNQIIPELEANAYSRWNTEQNRNLGLAEMYYNMNQDQQNRRLQDAQLAAQYGDYSGLQGLGIDTSQYEADELAEREWIEEQRAQARVEWANAAEDRKREIAIQMAELGDYSFAIELGMDLSELQKEQGFAEEQRAQMRKDWDTADADRKREIAIQMAELGDYSFANELGLSLTELRKEQENAEHERQVQDAQLAAAFGDYSGLQALGIDTSQYEADQQTAREQLLWEYARKRIEAGYADEEMAQLRKEWANAAEDRKLQIAQTLAAFGDYSALEALGVDTTQLRRQYAMSEAQLAAQYGDYSGLEELGVDVSQYKRAQQLDEAMVQAKYGDFSALKALGWDVSTAEKQLLLSYALQLADVGDLSLLKELGVDVSLLEAQNNYKLGQLSGYGSYGGTGGYSYNPGYTPEKEPEKEPEPTPEHALAGKMDSTIARIEKEGGVVIERNYKTGLIRYMSPGGDNIWEVKVEV